MFPIQEIAVDLFILETENEQLFNAVATVDVLTTIMLFRLLKSLLFSEKKHGVAMSISTGIHLIPYINLEYQIGIYVKINMRKRAEALTT